MILSHSACYLVVQNAGVESPLDYAFFQIHGYQGFYGGLGASQIKQQ